MSDVWLLRKTEHGFVVSSAPEPRKLRIPDQPGRTALQTRLAAAPSSHLPVQATVCSLDVGARYRREHSGVLSGDVG